MNSNQEKLIDYLSQYSFGSPFIFPPDEYKKGNATREPSDLICACNNTVLLFYMKRKKNTEIFNDTILTRRDKLISKNIGQLEGWIKEWRNGRSLIGKNEFNNFIINYGDYKNVIGIGIIDYTNDFCLIHQDLGDKIKINYCITISHDSFEKMFNYGFSLLDFTIIINQFKLKGVNKIISINQEIDEYFIKSLKKSSVKEITLSSIKETDIYFNSMRNQIHNNSKSKEANSISEILNDIELYESLKIRFLVAKTLQELKTNINIYQVVVIPLNKYKIVLSFSAWQNLKFISEKFHEAIDNYMSKNGLIGIMYEMNTLHPMIWITFKRENESTLELFLKNKTIINSDLAQ